MDLKRIAHDVAVESGMAHESLSALTAVIQEGIDRALAAKDNNVTRETMTELRALIEKRAWTHEDDYRVRQLVPALLDLIDEVEPLSGAQEEWRDGYLGAPTDAAAKMAARTSSPDTWSPGVNTDDARADIVLCGVLECALAWEPAVRLLGNVRAGDIARACREAVARLTALSQASRGDEAMSEQAQRQLAEEMADRIDRLEAENATLKQERDQIIAERAADRKRDDEVLYHVNQCTAAVVTERDKLLADVDGLTVDRDAAEAECDRLRQALKPLADRGIKYGIDYHDDDQVSVKLYKLKAAVAALSPSETEGGG